MHVAARKEEEAFVTIEDVDYRDHAQSLSAQGEESTDAQSDEAFIARLRKFRRFRKVIAPLQFVLSSAVVVSTMWIGSVIRDILQHCEFLHRTATVYGFCFGALLGFMLGGSVFGAFTAFGQMFLAKRVHRTEDMLLKYYDRCQEHMSA